MTVATGALRTGPGDELALHRPYEVPRPEDNGRAIALAVLMHALLAAFLFFGFHWQSSTPAVVEAELWSATPQTAGVAPRPSPPPPKVEPRPEPTPKAVEPEPPKVKVDIAEKPPKPEPKKEPVKVVEAPKPQPKPEPKPQPKPEPKPQPTPPKVEAKPKPEPVKPAPKAAVDAPPRPPSDLANLLASANSNATQGTGRDAQTSGPRGNKGYIARLTTAIRSQMRYPANSPGNPVVSMRIEQLPNGEVVDVTMIQSSGVPAFDAAVERAIRAASPLPRDEDGKVERVLNLDYKMYDR